MIRLLIGIAILIPLAAGLYVSLGSGSKKAKSKPAAKAELENPADPEKAPLLKVTNENFSELVEDNDKLVVLDFWAPWCEPCMMLGLHMEDIATEFEDVAVVGKVNTDQQQELGKQFGANTIPLVVILKNGEVVESLKEYSPKMADQIREAIKRQSQP